MNDIVSTPDTGAIDIEIVSHIATITLNNPDRLNALPQRLWELLPQRFDEAVDADARVIILTGADNNFCAGADISEFDAVRKNAETARRYEKANEEAFAAVRNCPVPVIARIDGFCLGGGFGLAAACDLRFASESAKFSVPAARLGLAYPVTAMADIVNAVGSQNTKRLLFTADRFSTQQMAEMGFIGETVSSQDLGSHVARVAAQIAELAPLTHRATKASVTVVLDGDKTTAMRLGRATFESDDYLEGRNAFREKRQPVFRGR